MEHEFERQLRALAIERRPEACLGCGFEHGCSVHGCAVIHAAVNRLAAYEETRCKHSCRMRNPEREVGKSCFFLQIAS